MRSKWYGKAQSQLMMLRMKQTKADNIRTEEEIRRRRATDPVEIAKTVLRRRGYQVYGERILGGDKAASDLCIVGRLKLTPAQVVEYAAKVDGNASMSEERPGG